MYTGYKSKMNEGEDQDLARAFGNVYCINREIVPAWTPGDIAEACRELHRAGLVECLYGDDMPQMVFLTSDGIAYEEGRTLRILQCVTDVAAKLLSLRP